MNNLIEKLGALALVPVVTIECLEDAVPLAKALCEGGLPVAEVTFRTPCAKEAIAQMVKAYPHMLIGAGTVITREQVDDAILAGAQFVVSPGLNKEVVQYAKEKGILMIPGCVTPSEVEAALALGLEFIKFFPAEAAGGLPMIQAMGAPYTNIKFMPTGGIHAGNIEKYLACDKIVACGGSWMVKGECIKAGKFEEITQTTQDAVKSMLGLKFEGMQILKDRLEDKKPSKLLSILGKEVTGIEEMPEGVHVSITYSTPYIKRVRAYLNAVGIELDEGPIRIQLVQR